MTNFWTYIATLLSGIIAGLLIFLKLKDPETTINENTQIGKMKQRGQGNSADITIKPGEASELTPREIRQARRAQRKAARIARRAERRQNV